MPDSSADVWDNSGSSKRVRWKRIVAVGMAVMISVLAVTTSMSWYRHCQQQAWKTRMEQAGAEVVLAGYGRGGPLSRIPVIRDFNVRTQVEVFLPNSRVADRVESDLHKCEELGRIWVHIRNVDRATRQRLEDAFPEVQFNGYTRPGE